MPRSQATVNTTFNAMDRMRGPMQNMQRRVTGFSRTSQRSLGNVSNGFRTLRRVAGIALAVMTTGRIARSVQDFAKAGDEIAKMSRELGLGSEALQEFRFAADRSGVESAELEKALGALNNRVGQLRQGQGSLSTALRDSNPELAAQLRNAEDTEEAFMVMMQALNETTNAADRAALAQAAFGRSGQSLTRMAENGADGLHDLRDEARRYGNIISNEAAAGAERFTDSMTNMRNALQAVRNRALQPLIENLQPLIQRMSDWVAANQDLIQQRIEETIERIGTAAAFVVRMWNNGVIPAILAGVVAFKAINTAIGIYQSVVATAKAVQMAFNVVMAANPIGLVIIAVAALVAGIVLLIQNFDKVKEVAGVVADWIAEKWQMVIGRIMDGVDRIRSAVRTVREFLQTTNEAERSTRLDPMGTRGMATNQTITRNNNSSVDVNFNNAPANVNIRSRGRAPGVSLNYGGRGVSP